MLSDSKTNPKNYWEHVNHRMDRFDCDVRVNMKTRKFIVYTK